MKKANFKVVANNRKAYFNYEIQDKFEAGIELSGSEIKQIRRGKANLIGSYARIMTSKNRHELFWLGGDIAGTPEPQRTRKLLVKKYEIKHLIGKTQEKGLTLVALELILKRGLAKLVVGIAKGKKIHDKREAIKRRDIKKENKTINLG